MNESSPSRDVSVPRSRASDRARPILAGLAKSRPRRKNAAPEPRRLGGREVRGRTRVDAYGVVVGLAGIVSAAGGDPGHDVGRNAIEYEPSVAFFVKPTSLSGR